MAGYIGSKASVTQVDGYNKTESDAEFLNDPASVITVSGSNVGIGTSSPVNNSNRTTLGLQGAWGGQLDIMVGSTVHAQFGTDNFSSGQSARIQSQDGIVFKTSGDNERMRIDSAGRVTMPYQPAFHVHGYGQVKPLGWNRVEFGAVALNRGGAYSTHRFTAPIAGMYTFNAGGYISADGAANRYAFALYHNGVGASFISGGVQASPDSPLASHSQLINMNANDYVEVYMYTPAAETLGAQFHPMWFQGYLIG